ncbi:MAG: hypothetical protein K0R18_2098 [Bacillales bacterium]|jgi:hypothetical protein|nr:hypothetical protein [Bacillales bacterium]
MPRKNNDDKIQQYESNLIEDNRKNPANEALQRYLNPFFPRNNDRKESDHKR